MSGARNQLSGVDHPAPQPPLGNPKTIRRIQGSNSLSVTVSRSKDVAISQARSKLPPIQMNHQYPVLESGALPPKLGKQQTPEIRASQRKKPREVRHLSWNIFAWSCLRGKATSRSTSKGLVISEPSNPVHLTPNHGNGSPKALERLPHLSQETDRQSTFLKNRDGEDPAIRDAPLQPRSHPPGLEVILTPDSELTEPHFNSNQPPTPPPLAPDIRNSRSRNLTVSDSWHNAYIIEHKKVCRLERRLTDLQREGERADHIENKDETETVVRLQNAEEKLKMQELKFKEAIEALQSACREKSDEVIAYRAEASQQRKYADHWRLLYENQVTKIDSIQKQLQQQNHEHPLADQVSDARPLNREHPLEETPSSPESAQCARVDSRELTVLSGAPMELDEISIPPTSAREVPRLTTPSVVCELSASSSHESLQSNGPVSQNNEEAPVTREMLVIPHEENINPASAMVEGMTDSEQEIPEIPYELPELLALRASFGDIFSVPERQQPHQQIESEEEEEAPSSPAPSQFSNPQSSSSAPEEEVNEAPSTRTRQVIYRFGSPRIEPAPPVFRVRLSNRARGSLTTEAILRMEGWEWDSVPELELRDPRDGGN